jgi:hypothetical protein
LPLSVLAQQINAAGKVPTWWEQVVGVLGIPTAIIGVAYSYVLIIKTRVETKKVEFDLEKGRSELEKLSLDKEKTRLEILEKKNALGEPAFPVEVLPAAETVVDLIVERSAKAEIANLVILKFVGLWLIVTLWSLLVRPYGEYLGYGIYRLIDELFALEKSGERSTILIIFLANLPSFVFGILILVLGIKVSKDVNAYLGIKMPNLVFWRKRCET